MFGYFLSELRMALFVLKLCFLLSFCRELGGIFQQVVRGMVHLLQTCLLSHSNLILTCTQGVCLCWIVWPQLYGGWKRSEYDRYYPFHTMVCLLLWYNKQAVSPHELFHNQTHHNKVMTLFRNRGWTAIIADMMIDTVLFMVSLGVGLLIGILSVAIAGVVGQGDTSTMAISFVIGAMIAYAICSTLFAVVSSAVNTVIVLYADVRTKWPWRLD